MYEWRYLWGSKVRHYLINKNIHNNIPAICGTLPSWFSSGWYGTGKQEEYEKIRTLRPCQMCIRNGAPEGPMKDE